VESSGGGDSEVQRTMMELLNQLDGFEPTQNIKVVMATNRIDILDPALLRPGESMRRVMVIMIMMVMVPALRDALHLPPIMNPSCPLHTTATTAIIATATQS